MDKLPRIYCQTGLRLYPATLDDHDAADVDLLPGGPGFNRTFLRLALLL